MRSQAESSDRRQSGIALVAVLLAVTLITVIGAALTAVGVVELRTSVNHRSSTRALLLADAGVTHAVGLLRGELSSQTFDDVLVGWDGLGGTADDGVLDGFDLAVEHCLPDTGVPLGQGRYFVRIENDLAEAATLDDKNFRLLAVSRGETPDGGSAEVRVVLVAPSYPALATDGDLILEGDPAVRGPCAGVHANKKLHIKGKPKVDNGNEEAADEQVSASEELVPEGTVYDDDGNVVEPKIADPIDIPEYDPLSFCEGEVDYWLSKGKLTTVDEPSTTVSLKGKGAMGWSWSGGENTYTLNGNEAVPGTYCSDGNVRATGTLGSSGDPLPFTLLASGSVRIGGTPVIKPDHSQGLLIVAGGDVELGGNPAGNDPYYAGMVYGQSQCKINGTPILEGHLLCQDDPNAPGTADYVSESKVNGTPRIRYDCTGERRRTHVSDWWEVRTQ